jgi:hypothetical protein
MRRLMRRHGPCGIEARRWSPYEALTRAVAHQRLNGRAAHAAHAEGAARARRALEAAPVGGGVVPVAGGGRAEAGAGDARLTCPYTTVHDLDAA